MWLVAGAVVGVGIAIGDVAYLAGAARSLADDAQRLVGTGGSQLVASVASHGAPKRVVLGFAAVIGVLLPGVTALLLVIAARGTLRVRAVIAVLIAALGIASFAYQPHGVAFGAVGLALAVAAVAVALTGPLVTAPLCALAGLIGGEYLPRLVSTHPAVAGAAISDLHQALTGVAGTPLWVRLVLLMVAVVPFAVAARLIVKG